MILADKIIAERKKNGWSQEELAEKLDVSRQSVSKWEGAQSVPDLQKILKMSELFGVSTDYLLKDDIEETECIVMEKEEEYACRKVSMEEANAFLDVNAIVAQKNAFATALCILSPICLFMLGGMTTIGVVSENVASGIGMIVLLLMIVCAVAIFILNSRSMEKYQYLEKELIETAYGVSGMVKDRKQKYESTYTKNLIMGVAICIVGVIALFVVPIIGEDEMFGVTMLCVMLIFEAGGVFILVRNGSIQTGFTKLLQEGDYSIRKKKDTTTQTISKVYWLLAIAIFLAWSFGTNDWGKTWMVWPVAAVLFPAIIAISKLMRKDKENNND